MLHSFAKFVTWPNRVFDRDNKIVLGILGDDPFGSTIEDVLRGRSVKGRNWEVIRGNTISDLKGSHLIFIGKSNEANIKELLRDIYSKRNASVLTIGDNIENFCQLGGMINYKSGSYSFDINAEALTNANLLVDVNLLKVANEIVNYGN